jgi:hypothetical protein
MTLPLLPISEIMLNLVVNATLIILFVYYDSRFCSSTILVKLILCFFKYYFELLSCLLIYRDHVNRFFSLAHETSDLGGFLGEGLVRG